MFTGFTDATVDFLWGIRFNNERPWFEAHKETYLSELYRPMKDLGAEIYDFLSADNQSVCPGIIIKHFFFGGLCPLLVEGKIRSDVFV